MIASPAMIRPTRLAIVVPCYNEQDVLPETSQRLNSLLDGLVASGAIIEPSRIYFVDDGSKDRTWPIIEAHAAEFPRVAGIKLSRNCGHQNALIAGLFSAEGDAVITVDADLQDDLDAIGVMVQRFQQGADVVYGVRKQRHTDSALKRLSAEAFYSIMTLLGADSVHNHADYRLMSRRAVEALKQYKEVNLYLRGIVPLIGFESSIVYYDRVARFAGESKYPLRRMIGLALDAITSFSTLPLRLITLVGFLVFVASMLVTVWTLWVRFVRNDAVPGWTSIVLPMYFLGGVQIFCIGIIGEYLGKTYSETKSRPRYFIEKIIREYKTGQNEDSAAKQSVEAEQGTSP